MSSTLHLIDASPYIFRAFFALPDSIRDRDGNSVHAAYGFASFLLKYVDDHAPTHLAVTFDRSLNSSFRNEIYPEYKAQRELPPADLERQLDLCVEITEALGIATFIDDRYEADDLIATLLHQVGGPAVIVTLDKDLAQLVTDDVTFFDIGKEKRYDVAGVIEKFGVRPAQIPDYLGLVGDSVDNIPGVAGIGPKSAAVLLAHFSSIEELLENLDRVDSLPIRGAKSIAAKLREHAAIARLSKELATVSAAAPVQTTREQLEYRGADRAKLTALCERVGFNTLPTRVKRWS